MPLTTWLVREEATVKLFSDHNNHLKTTSSSALFSQVNYSNTQEHASFPLWRDQESFIMKDGERQLLGLVLAIIGFSGSFISCALPTWIFTSWNTAKGLWKSCVFDYYQTTQMQCKTYDSLHDLPMDFQAARVLIVIAIIVGIFGIMVGVVGGNCTTLMSNKRKNSKEAIASGIVFITAGCFVFMPVCKVTINITMTRMLSNSVSMGASLYIGWAASGLLLLGGGLLCCSCYCRKKIDLKVEYPKPCLCVIPYNKQ